MLDNNAVDLKFENIGYEELKALALHTDYLMTLSLKPDQVQEKYGVEFSPVEDPLCKFFAAIKEPKSGIIFEFKARSRDGTICVNAKGKKLDARDAYEVFMAVFAFNMHDVSWISDSI